MRETGNHDNEQEQSETSEAGPQSPTTRVNPRTLNVKYVADPSLLPIETEASTASNDPLNLVSFDGDLTVSSTARTSSKDDSGTGQGPVQTSRGGSETALRRDYKDELDSPTGIPLANNIQLLAHPMQAAMAAASPTILSQSTVVMGYGQFESFIPVSGYTESQLPAAMTPQTHSSKDSNPSQLHLDVNLDSPSPTSTHGQDVDSKAAKCDVSSKLDSNQDTGRSTDPLTDDVDGSSDKEMVSLVNGTVVAGDKTNAEMVDIAESGNQKQGLYGYVTFYFSLFSPLLFTSVAQLPG